MGGTAAVDPVAMTKYFARTSCVAERTSRRPAKVARSAITWTPSPVKRSTESCGAMVAMTSATWRFTAAKSMAGAVPVTPMAGLPCAWRAAFAAASSAFDGTQPLFRQSPPMRPASNSTTRAPNCAAPAATLSPPDPPPMTQMSVSICFMTYPFHGEP